MRGYIRVLNLQHSITLSLPFFSISISNHGTMKQESARAKETLLVLLYGVGSVIVGLELSIGSGWLESEGINPKTGRLVSV